MIQGNCFGMPRRLSSVTYTPLTDLQVLSFISLISAPAANTFSPPVITIALMESSLSALSSSAFKSSKSGVLSAFLALGRFKVRITTLLDGDLDERTSFSDDIARDCARSDNLSGVA
jgi:hypothetical protein